MIKEKEQKLTVFFLLLLCFFLCFGYTTGSDWPTYENLYEASTDEDKSYLFLFFEPGFVFYIKLFKSLGIAFFPFLIFTKILVYIVVISSLKFYCPKNTFYLSLLFYISWYAFFLFIDNPLRNFIAIAIFLRSLKYLRERRFIPYLFMTLLAMSFHVSAVIMLILYYFANKSYKTNNIVFFYIVTNIILLSKDLIFSIVNFLFSSVPIVGAKIEGYAADNVNAEGKLLSMGLIVHTLIFILIILGRKRIEIQENGKLIFMFSILSAILFRLGLTITVFGRFQLYITVFYVAAIGIIYYAFDLRSRVFYLLFVSIISIIPCVSYLIKDSRYIPYTNYMFFLDTNLTLEQRESYNNKNSDFKSLE
ncbi:EpsG family protein [Flavobacterium ustbae]|uniref:EpsG family protein n=1 Tax=Flavobacterium ustbae TaxID=2488790 RepID=UPI0013DDE49C|nr:EpsG family protein [Flavobacterium ustbae]